MTSPRTPARASWASTWSTTSRPNTSISEDRRREVASISKAAGRADTVYLATDLDREGEAIAWHVAEAADIPQSPSSAG